MTTDDTKTTAGGSPLDGGVRPSPSEWKCSHCGFPLPRHGGALRHYGTHTAHQENECLRLLRAEIERLRAELQARHWRQHEAEALAGHYLVQRDDAREALAAERERCAKLVEDYPRVVDTNGDWGTRGDTYPQEHAVLAAAIRGA